MTKNEPKMSPRFKKDYKSRKRMILPVKKEI